MSETRWRIRLFGLGLAFGTVFFHFVHVSWTEFGMFNLGWLMVTGIAWAAKRIKNGRA
jgi:hypothetical protein